MGVGRISGVDGESGRDLVACGCVVAPANVGGAQASAKYATATQPHEMRLGKNVRVAYVTQLYEPVLHRSLIR
jgi:hypothetical protein